MSSFYDDASLVVIPSGYKTSKVYAEKPTDGSGDLAFTRTGDTATRVNSAGLIEKVRTNLVTYSEDFSNAAWNKLNVTLTSGQTDPNGGSTASTVDPTNTTSAYVRQSISITSGVKYTWSVYIKGSTAGQSIALYTDGASNIYEVKALTTSWQRFTGVATAASSGSSGFYILSGSGYSGLTDLPFDIAFGQVEASDVATAYIPTTTAAVSTGPVANVPRLDYLGSTCPRLLLEPQRTNLALYSEQFNNAAWLNGQNSGAATITANQIISPDGYLDADKIAFPSVGAGGQYNLLFQPFTASATAYTASAYLRGENGGEVVWLSFTKDGVNYNRTQCTLTTAWQRFTLSATLTAGSDNFQIGVDTRDSSQSARPAQTIYAWGAQLEQGAYSTSLIPTLAASATRGADACSKTGISSLIGQTEGTVFVEFKRVPKGVNYQAVVTLQGASASYLIEMYFGSANTLTAAVYNAGAQFQAATSALSEGTYKAALAYKENDFAFYVNGVQISTDNSGTVPALSTYNLGDFSYLAGYPQADGINQALLFKTRLTNAELAELTTL